MTFLDIVSAIAVLAILTLLIPPSRPSKASARHPLHDQSPLVGLLNIASQPINRRLVYFIAADGARYDCSLYSGHFIRSGPALSPASADAVMPWSLVYLLLSPQMQSFCVMPEQRVTYSRINARHRPVDLDLAELNLIPA